MDEDDTESHRDRFRFCCGGGGGFGFGFGFGLFVVMVSFLWRGFGDTVAIHVAVGVTLALPTKFQHVYVTCTSMNFAPI